ncbi:MAG: TonB-dependent receptor plug domain-containing protein [bacterium JZ-2024 1]
MRFRGGANLFRFLCAILLVLVSPLRTYGAGDGEENSDFVGEIIVEAERPVPSDDREVYPFFVIRPRASSGNRSLADLVKWVPGVTVLETGSRAGVSTFLYRGTPSLHTRVFWNDIPMDLSYSGFLDFSEIPAEGIKSITVGARLGEEWLFGSPPGAVVSIESQPLSRSHLVKASTGSYGHQALTITGQAGKSSFRTHTESEDGNFSFLNDNGTAYNKTDDFTDYRRNNGFREWSAQVDAGRGKHPLNAWVSQTREGVPGLYSIQAAHPYLERTRALVRSQAQTKKGTVSVFAGYEAEVFRDEHGEVTLIPTRVTNTNWRVGGSMRERFFYTQSYLDVWRRHDLRTDTRKTFVKWSGHLGWSWSGNVSWKDAFLDASLGLQYEWKSSEAPQMEPVAGARIFWGPLRSTRFLGIRRVHRFPTFFERFGNRGTIVGNRNLVPESGFSVEFGVARTAATSQSILTVYATRISNLIYYFQNSQSTFVARNFARAIFYGVEASRLQRINSRSGFLIGLTYQRARAMDAGYLSGRDLPNRPYFLYSATLNQRVGTMEIRIELKGRQGGYFDPGNLLPIPPRATVDLEMMSHVRGMVDITIGARNLLNETGLDFVGYPLPGRNYTVSILWNPDR